MRLCYMLARMMKSLFFQMAVVWTQRLLTAYNVVTGGKANNNLIRNYYREAANDSTEDGDSLTFPGKVRSTVS